MRLKNRLFWIAAFIAFFLNTNNKILGGTNLQLGANSTTLNWNISLFTYVSHTWCRLSLLSGKVEWLRWLSFGVSLVLIAFALFTGPTLNLWDQLGYGYSLILGGAMGNGIDRFVLGHVVDFLDFRLISFPVFNVADSLFSIGIVFLLIASFQKTPTSTGRLD